MEEGPTVHTLRVLASQAGLELTDEELIDVLPGVMRNLAMAKTVRKWAAASVEPPTASPTPPARA